MPRVRQYIDRHRDARRRVVDHCKPDVHRVGIFVEAIHSPDDPSRIGLVERLSNLDWYSRHGSDPPSRDWFKTSTVGSDKRTNDQWTVGRIDSRRHRTQAMMMSLIWMPAILFNSRRLLVSPEISSSDPSLDSSFNNTKVALMSA